MKHGTDTIMTVTAFGMFVYSTFTIIAGRGSVRVNATSSIPLIEGVQKKVDKRFTSYGGIQ